MKPRRRFSIDDFAFNLLGAKVPHLHAVGLKDVFVDATGVKLAADQRSVTVTLTFRDEGRTLTSEEVDRAVETLRDHAKAELGAVFRSLIFGISKTTLPWGVRVNDSNPEPYYIFPGG